MQGVEGLIYDFTFLFKQFKLLGVILLDFFDLLLKTVKSLFKSLRQQLKLFVDNLFKKRRGNVEDLLPFHTIVRNKGWSVLCKDGNDIDEYIGIHWIDGNRVVRASEGMALFRRRVLVHRADRFTVRAALPDGYHVHKIDHVRGEEVGWETSKGQNLLTRILL